MRLVTKGSEETVLKDDSRALIVAAENEKEMYSKSFL